MTDDHRIPLFNHQPVQKFHVSNKGEYGIFLLDGNTLIIYSSFGSYGHHWSHPGTEIRKFLIGLDKDYLLGKLSPSDWFARRPVDFYKTFQRVREEILRDRRDEDLTKEQAREEWKLSEKILEHHEGYLWEWYEQTGLRDASELTVMKPYPGQLEGLYRYLWPGFTSLLEEQLKPKQHLT